MKLAARLTSVLLAVQGIPALPWIRVVTESSASAEQEPDPPQAPAPEERYPQRRAETVVRFFSVASETPDLPAVTVALEELDASVLYGPRTSSVRPGACFLAVRAPVGTSSKDVAKALRKAGGAARELTCVAFDGHNPGGMLLEETLSMFRTVAWIDNAGSWTQMYLDDAPNAKEASALIERYEMLWEGNLKLGQLARDTFTWTLSSVPDDKSATRILKAIRKLDGVVGASLAGADLELTVQLLALGASGDSGALPLSGTGAGQDDAAGRIGPRATWPTQPLYDLLASEKLLPP